MTQLLRKKKTTALASIVLGTLVSISVLGNDNPPVCQSYSIGEMRLHYSGFSRSTGGAIGATNLNNSQSRLRLHDYAILAVAPNHFQVHLNIRFHKNSFHPTQKPGTWPVETMEKHVLSCLQSAKNKTKGPNGEILEFVLNSGLNIAVNPVFIAERSTRANNGSYPDEVSCSTVLHEVLHLVGLRDEYKEAANMYYVDPRTGQLYKAEYAPEHTQAYEKIRANYCRPFIVEGSIMSIPRRAFELVQHPTMILRDGEQNKSLIMPLHFRKILFPNCEDQSGEYNACMANAYKLDYDYPGRVCPTLPEVCQTPDWLY